MGRVRRRKYRWALIAGGLLAMLLSVTACKNTLLLDRIQDLAFMGWWDETSWDDSRFGD